MGAGASAKKRAKAGQKDALIREEGKDGLRSLAGRTLFAVKVLDGGPTPLKSNTEVRLAVCEDFLELLDLSSMHVITSFRYRDIPYWSITPEIFSFKYNYERVPRPGGNPSLVRACDIKLRTRQAKEISVTLRTHVYKKAHEIARKKRSMGVSAYTALEQEVREGLSGLEVLKNYADAARSVAEAASAEVARATSTVKKAPDSKEDPGSNATLIDSVQGKQLVLALPDPFEMIDGACAIYPVLIDQRNFEHVLSAFETEEDRDNVCHRLKIPYAMSRERSDQVAIIDLS